MKTASPIHNEGLHYESVYAYATTGVIITDNQGRMVAVNPYALKMFGYRKKELINCKIEKLVPGRFRKKHTTHHVKYIEKPYTRLMGEGLHLYARKKNGEEFPVEVSLTDYHIEGRTFILAFIADITTKRNAEEKIEKLNASLEATVEKRTCDLHKTLLHLEQLNTKLQDTLLFQNAILENAGVIIISGDTKGIIQTFNREAECELGYKESEVIGQKNFLLFHTKEELKARALHLSLLQQKPVKPDMSVFFTEARLATHNEHEWMFKRKNGSGFPVLGNFANIYNVKGELIGYLCVGMNITEHKKNEQNLKKALEKEKELGELKSRFVSIASHEFRTPLSTIASSAFLIEKYQLTQDQPKRKQHVEHILEAVDMLTGILNDFLNVGNIEEGKIVVRPSAFNIKKSLSKLSEDLSLTLKKQQTIRYQHKGPEEVQLDPSLLKHIIMNLISNASKFSDEGGKIALTTTVARNSITLSVSDNGMGIPEDDQKHLMQPFFRGSNVGNIQGTGLGLHIVSKYAALMNGTVSWSSKPGKGTTFKIIFNI